MLHDFLRERRAEILANTVAKIAAKAGAGRSRAELEDSLPYFYDALVSALRRDAGVPADATPDPRDLSSAHAQQRHRAGFTITDVVADYGSLCNSIMDAAQRYQQDITVREYQIVNLVLDEGIASGVQRFQTERSALREYGAAERLGFVAHEMRNALQNATLSFEAIRTGRIAVQGRTAELIEKSHQRLLDLIALLTNQVRLAAQPLQREQLTLKEVVEEAVSSVRHEAGAREMEVAVAVPEGVVVSGNRNLLHSLLANLLQNAIKYSRRGGRVELRGSQTQDLSAQIEVEDECGGLREGAAESFFQPFFQDSANRSGLGLGLAITREIVEAHGGTISVANLPGKGCIFTVRLPAA